MTDVTFSTPQQALDALDTRPQGEVYIDGVTVDAISWSSQTDVDSTATSRISLALPSTVADNAVVQVQAGHNDLIGTMYSGRVPSWEKNATNRGNLLDVRAAGWSSLLAYRSRFDLSFDGPISPAALFDSLCSRYGVPAYIADDVTDPTGTIAVTIGGNPNIDGGRVVMKASQTPLSFLRDACEPFGYRVYDTEDGILRLSRFSGLPVGDPVVTFTEGVHPFSMRYSYDIGGIVNYPDINGQTYEDEWGASVPIRAFPATVVSDDRIPVNDGVNYRDIRNSLLVTQQQAEIALAVYQNDNAAPSTLVRWDAIAVPGMSVGDVVALDFSTVGVEGVYWLQSMDIKAEGSALTASYTAWSGAGIAMPAGRNVNTTRIQTGVTHLGDETRSNYAVPTPSGLTMVWPITIPDRATALTLTFWHHGTNSQVVGGVETDLEVSSFEVWPDGVDMDDEDNRPELSGKLAILSEELRLSRNYSTFTVASDGTTVTDPGFWKPGKVNLDRLDAGDYNVRLRAGEKNGFDDFEMRLIDLLVYGTNEPLIIPGENV